MSKKKIYVICPVRKITTQEKEFLADYVYNLEDNFSCEVFLPFRNNVHEDTDPIGTQIVDCNLEAIRNASEVHIFYKEDSLGSLFDLGAAMALKKPVKWINRSSYPKTEGKSFVNVLHELDANGGLL